MKNTTLQDFQDADLSDTMSFLSAHGLLRPLKFRERVRESYGSASSRNEALHQIVNEITLMYLDSSTYKNRRLYNE